MPKVQPKGNAEDLLDTLLAYLEALSASRNQEAADVLSGHPEIMSEGTAEFLRQLVEAQDDPQMRAVYERLYQAFLVHQTTLKALESRAPGANYEFEDSIYRLLDELQKERTTEGRARIFETHPELISEEADVVFQQLADIQPTPEARSNVQELRAVFQQLRRMRIDSGYGDSER